MTTKETPTNFPEHNELFDVVLIKADVNDLAAKPGDFKRVTVEASDPSAAQYHADVRALTGYRVMFAVPPGVSTEPEIMARRREMEGPTVDRSKI
jgi:hypothetical protein